MGCRVSMFKLLVRVYDSNQAWHTRERDSKEVYQKLYGIYEEGRGRYSVRQYLSENGSDHHLLLEPS